MKPMEMGDRPPFGTMAAVLLVAVASLLLLMVAKAGAQTPAAASWILEWEQPADGSPIADYTHLLSIDGAAPVPVAATCVQLVAGQPASCASLLPAMTPGEHSIRVVSRVTANGVNFDAGPADGDSIEINLIAVVGPTNVRVTVVR
jgi:hypothetical protein